MQSKWLEGNAPGSVSDRSFRICCLRRTLAVCVRFCPQVARRARQPQLKHSFIMRAYAPFSTRQQQQQQQQPPMHVVAALNLFYLRTSSNDAHIRACADQICACKFLDEPQTQRRSAQNEIAEHVYGSECDDRKAPSTLWPHCRTVITC